MILFCKCKRLINKFNYFLCPNFADYDRRFLIKSGAEKLMCAQLQTAVVSFNVRSQPHTGAGGAPAANGALQAATEVGALRRQRERSDRTGKREGRREVQNGQVVEHCGGVVAGMYQHVVHLSAAIERRVE